MRASVEQLKEGEEREEGNDEDAVESVESTWRT